MPSIIEVDTIKNKTGTQNTVLSTDGSGNNTLNAGVIKSNTGSNTGLTIASDGQITVNQNNPTITLGSNTTFPDGYVVQSKTVKYTGGDHNTTSTTIEVCKDYASITGVTIGNTIIFCWDGSGFVERATGDHDVRYSQYYLYHHTVLRNEGYNTGDGSLGTQLQKKQMGRQGMSASPGPERSYLNFSLSAPFVATATTHYVGLAFTAESSTVANEVFANATNPLYCFIYEIKGDVTT